MSLEFKVTGNKEAMGDQKILLQVGMIEGPMTAQEAQSLGNALIQAVDFVRNPPPAKMTWAHAMAEPIVHLPHDEKSDQEPDQTLDPQNQLPDLLRFEVQAFAWLMEQRLRTKDECLGDNWKTMSGSECIKELKTHLLELDAYTQGLYDGKTAANKAADVANFAMFLAHVSAAYRYEPDFQERYAKALKRQNQH